jgi:hypothetical protein
MKKIKALHYVPLQSNCATNDNIALVILGSFKSDCTSR